MSHVYGRSYRSFIIVGCAALLSACGGSGSGSQSPSIGISPTSATIDGGTSISLTASGGQPPYSFSVTAGSGSVTSAGVFTAPSTAGSATVTATDVAGARALTQLTFNSALGLTPFGAAVGVNTTQKFQAVGGQVPYKYAVASGVGAIDAGSGVYQAPDAPGAASIEVTDGLGTTVTSTLTVNPTLSVQPRSITITSSSGQKFAFSGHEGALDYQYAVVSGPGSIDAAGVYTAGTDSGPAVIRVTDRQGTSSMAAVTSIRIRTNGPVYAAVSDGSNWFLGGTFTAVNPYEAPRGAVIDPVSGAPQLGCDLQTGFDNQVNTALYAGSTLYVGGYFTHYRGQSAPGLVALDAKTCELVSTFFQTSDGGVYVSALAASGSSLYIAGSFNSYRGVAQSPTVYSVIKVDAKTGTRDATFAQPSTPLIGTPAALIATPTSLYVGGNGVVLWDAVTGAPVNTFNAQAGAITNVFTMQMSGSSLFVGGYFGGAFGNLAKLDAASGAVDPAFNSTSVDGFDDAVQSVVLAGSSLYVGGRFNRYRSQSSAGVAKISAVDGSLDSTFHPGTGFDGTVNGLVVGGTSVYLAGSFTTYQDQPAVRLAKIDAASGALDSAFTQATGLDNTPSSLVSNGASLFAGGVFRTYRGQPASNLTKLNANGIADAAFTSTPGTNGKIDSLLLVNNALYAGGWFSSYNGAAANFLAKIDSHSGALDAAFTHATGLNDIVLGLASNGSALFVGGRFTAYRGATCNGLAKLDLVSGALDTVFTQAAGLPSQTLVSTIGSNGPYIYFTDNSPTYAGVAAPPFGRANATTGVYDAAFAANAAPAAGAPTAFAFSPTAVYVAENYFLEPVHSLDSNTGTTNAAFVPSVPVLGSPPIPSMMVLGNFLYVGGYYSQNGFLHSPAKLNAITGAVDTTFSDLFTTDAGVETIAVSGTSLYFGGDFTTYKNARGYYFVPVDPLTGNQLDP
jgi:Domain of unknown function (DUF5122) beta-propeller